MDGLVEAGGMAGPAQVRVEAGEAVDGVITGRVAAAVARAPPTEVTVAHTVSAGTPVSGRRDTGMRSLLLTGRGPS
ncbi:hypothetical protein [Streptomyces sp. NPDC002520]